MGSAAKAFTKSPRHIGSFGPARDENGDAISRRLLQLRPAADGAQIERALGPWHNRRVPGVHVTQTLAA